ncbi:nicotinate (nicotinamide) nucleotide adenylyltransferase [Acetobacteraceae bacterium]|nr:nicotinate (nicotinamide) nucleotide adenylyltransferase [Acetobacteraceae bacterium]
MRVGILGGSFNPAHVGHISLARRALKSLNLDQIWLMVSPQNPFKPSKGMAPFAERLASAKKLADGRKIIATDIEQRFGTKKTFLTVQHLQKHFPKISFTWLIGADNLPDLCHWYRGRDLIQKIPIAVCARPGCNKEALKSSSASWMRRWQRPEYKAGTLGEKGAPDWVFLHGREVDLSSTEIRKLALEK